MTMPEPPGQQPSPTDEENLRLLSSFFVPLPFEERVRQEQLYADQKGGTSPGLSADDVKLAMMEIFEGWR